VPPALDQERYWRFALDAHLRELEAGEGAFFFVFAAHSPDEVIGFVQYSAIVGEPRHSAHVGYALSEQHAGNGLMAEALRPTLPWAFDTFGLHRLEAYYLPHNRASGGVLKKLGFRVEGLAREFTQVGQRWEDHLCASLLVHELRGRRP
jgi:ribosomal-protein-alanine N-acetyltransferase